MGRVEGCFVTGDGARGVAAPLLAMEATTGVLVIIAEWDASGDDCGSIFLLKKGGPSRRASYSSSVETLGSLVEALFGTRIANWGAGEACFRLCFLVKIGGPSRRASYSLLS